MKDDILMLLFVTMLIAAIVVGIFSLAESFTADKEPPVSRFIDCKNGIVCYTTNGGGIDCLPIGQTRLKRSSQ